MAKRKDKGQVIVLEVPGTPDESYAGKREARRQKRAWKKAGVHVQGVINRQNLKDVQLHLAAAVWDVNAVIAERNGQQYYVVTKGADGVHEGQILHPHGSASCRNGLSQLYTVEPFFNCVVGVLALCTPQSGPDQPAGALERPQQAQTGEHVRLRLYGRGQIAVN